VSYNASVVNFATQQIAYALYNKNNFLPFKNALAYYKAYYSAGVVVENSGAVGLGPGVVLVL
jgi:hypothetical protein